MGTLKSHSEGDPNQPPFKHTGALGKTEIGRVVCLWGPRKSSVMKDTSPFVGGDVLRVPSLLWHAAFN